MSARAIYREIARSEEMRAKEHSTVRSVARHVAACTMRLTSMRVPHAASFAAAASAPACRGPAAVRRSEMKSRDDTPARARGD
jgi:hypothetical protein